MIDIDITRKLDGADGTLNLRFNTKINSFEFVTIYGPSGAGKTSILKMLAGLFEPDHGHIQVNGEIWFDKSKKVSIKPQLRKIGMVFQDYSLFPNMTVRGNLEFALERGQSPKVVDELLQLTGLENLQHKKPLLLSGGQKQRVALARALVRKPNLLLLDEPFSALDLEMQSRLQDYVLQVHQQFKLTTILVSHDLAEVLKMSNRVLIFEDGNIKNDGTPGDVLPIDSLRSFLRVVN
jgi:molybdate transport system ATP-binding protein